MPCNSQNIPDPKVVINFRKDATLEEKIQWTRRNIDNSFARNNVNILRPAQQQRVLDSLVKILVECYKIDKIFL